MNIRALARSIVWATGLAALMLLTGEARPAWCSDTAAPSHGNHGMLPPAAVADHPHTDSLYNVESVWSDQDGARVALKSLRGQLRIVAMVYTSCQYVCPLIVNDMLTIERRLPPGMRGKVHFALFSFDPERDSAPVLKAYAAKRGLDERRWRLYTGAPDNVLELAAVLGVRYRKEPNGEFSHSTIITLLDREGIVRHQVKGQKQDPAPMVAAITAAAGK